MELRIFVLFEGISGFAKIRQPGDLLSFHRSQTNGPRSSFDDGQLLTATNVLTFVLIYSNVRMATNSYSGFDV